ncbi:MAG: hypothetical protein A2V66_18295, partial [Ignavibacteria bacterium RBG_13_36_8]
LATVQATLGIAHPTGYPLFTIIGYVFLSLPLPFTKIFLANSLAAILCSLTIVLFLKSLKIILHNISINQPKIKNIETVKICTTIFSGLVLAFSETFWFQSTSVEVYSLQVFLIMSIIYLLLKTFYSSLESDYQKKGWYFLAIMLALGFSNHMTTILIIPGIAFLFFTKEKFNKDSFKKVSLMLLFFIPVLAIIYAYLPIRAAQNPILNWGNPVDLERFFRHFTGKQYQVWLFSSFTSAKQQLIYFIRNLPGEFTVFSLFFVIVGIIYSYKFFRKIFFFLMISFLVTVLYSINYDINDIDSYFLLAYLSLAFFSFFGLLKIFQFVSSKGLSNTICAIIIGLFVLVQFYWNFDKVDQSDIYTFEDYTKAVLSSTETNSVIFSYQWDYFISASYYFQFVENFRADVTVIDKELLRRSWYYRQLQTNNPEVLSGMHSEIIDFNNAIMPFERGEKYDSNLLEKYYRRIMTGLILKNIDERNYYIGPELVENELRRGEFSLPDGYTIVPQLFLFKITRGDEYVPAPDPNYHIRFPSRTNRYVEFIERIATTMLLNRTIYELRYDKIDRARIYIQKLKKEFPKYRIPAQFESLL